MPFDGELEPKLEVDTLMKIDKVIKKELPTLLKTTSN
jgi:hypothetical protein